MKFRRCSHGFLTVWAFPGLVTLLLLCPSGRVHAQWESVDHIGQLALGYAQQRYTVAGADVEATVKSLDPNLRLADCDQPLQAFVPANQSGPRQNVVVGVRCRGTRPWKVYVPVQMSIRRDVLVARHPMARGQVISSADVQLEKREISHLRSAYLTDVRLLSGKMLKRSIREGGLITADLLEAEDAVKRGQQVTLVTARNGFKVQMAGIALGNAAVDERVRVENSSSGRTVEGVVRSHQLVEVITY